MKIVNLWGISHSDQGAVNAVKQAVVSNLILDGKMVVASPTYMDQSYPITVPRIQLFAQEIDFLITMLRNSNCEAVVTTAPLIGFASAFGAPNLGCGVDHKSQVSLYKDFDDLVVNLSSQFEHIHFLIEDDALAIKSKSEFFSDLMVTDEKVLVTNGLPFSRIWPTKLGVEQITSDLFKFLGPTIH